MNDDEIIKLINKSTTGEMTPEEDLRLLEILNNEAGNLNTILDELEGQSSELKD
jgi:hypothetical protein